MVKEGPIDEWIINETFAFDGVSIRFFYKTETGQQYNQVTLFKEGSRVLRFLIVEDKAKEIIADKISFSRYRSSFKYLWTNKKMVFDRKKKMVCWS